MPQVWECYWAFKSLCRTLLKYLKLQDGNPKCAELHQHGPQGPVDMVIPNTSLAECCFEMFNKQPAGYLYHVVPTFGASDLCIKTLLRRSMDAGLTTEAPLCTYDPATNMLTTPRDLVQEGVLSDVHSLPFFQDVLADKLAVDTSKKSKTTYTAPEMCFQLGSACSVQTVHGKNDGKHNNVSEPCVNFCPATKAPAADPSNADQPELDGLGMKEVVGDFTARQLGATYFCGSEPIDGVWATGNITVTNACVMPVGFGVDDHRLFVFNIATMTLVGSGLTAVGCPTLRCLNTRISGCADRYNRSLCGI